MNAKNKLLAKLKPPVQEQAVVESSGPGKTQTIPQPQSAPPIIDPRLQQHFDEMAVIRDKPKPMSLADKLRAKAMGATDRREQQADGSQSEDTIGQSVLDSEPIGTTVVSAAPSNSKPSLADMLRAKATASATQDKQQVLNKVNPVGMTPDSTPQQEDTSSIPPDNYPPAVSYPKAKSYSLADALRAKAKRPTTVIADDIVDYANDEDTLRKQLDRLKATEVTIEESFDPTDEGPESFGLDLLDRYGNPITLNEKQASGVDYAISGQNYVLTGEAGTGKSTAIQAVCKSLLRYHKDKLTTTDYRAMDRSGSRVSAPSICVCSYTRKAVANVQRITSMDFELSAEMEGCFQTIHNLLEYSPVITWSEIQQREVQMFKPTRGEFNPLNITHLIIEEASMLGLDLWAELRAALNPGVQIIYVGDINQLPPVFGKSVMSYALTKLPIVHLDIVYRQALDNPIIANAHAVLHGRDIREDKPAFTWIQGKSKVAQPQETMSRAMGEFFRLGLLNKEKIDTWKQELENFNNLPPFSDLKGIPHPKTMPEIKEQEDAHVCYDPEQDIILIPFNKNAMGTTQVNYRIAQHLGEKRGAEVFEIIASYEKHYLAVGDKVFCHKMEGTIVKIVGNMNYMGRSPMKSSVNLSRFGFYVGSAAEEAAKILNGDDDFDYSHLDIDVLATIDENEERRQASSHLVDIELETGQVITLSSAGDFNTQIFQLGYALSIHKSQGSEWRRVFILFHKAHASMLSRELLYTAMTRAREELVIVARPELISRAIVSPRIKGNSLAEKIEYFNSGYLDENVEVTV